ncbi:MAG: hypothetical protein JL50_11320 [Peptococcaceae bacterium BICA1-7]|nr:MAG: hypothetical protein JL50_11320 [Peptococcaceae bacterium BICA1-7]
MDVKTDNVFVVFNKKNLSKAMKWCRNQKEEWLIIEAFEKRKNIEESPIKCLNIFDLKPYRPDTFSPLINKLIISLFEDSFLDGSSLNNRIIEEGVPLLRTKDNDLYVATYNRYYYLLKSLDELLNCWDVKRVVLAVGSFKDTVVCEWPNYHFLIDDDIILGPWLAAIRKKRQLRTETAGLVNGFIGLNKLRLREALLAIYRLLKIIERGLKWKDRRINLGKGPRIALWVRSQGHVQSQERLIRQWNSNVSGNIFYIQDDSYKKNDCISYLRSQKDLPYISCHSYIRVRWIIESFVKMLWFRLIVYKKISFKHSQDWAGDFVAEVFDSNAFRREIIKSLSEAIFTGGIISRELAECYRKLEFKIMLVLGNIDQWGNVAAYIGRKFNFKTISVQNMMLDLYQYPSPVIHDEMIVYDQEQKRIMTACGKAQNTITTLGSPLFDSYWDNEQLDVKRKKTLSKIGAVENSNVLLCATQSWSDNAMEENSEICETVIEFCRRNLNSIGIIKLHPYEKLSDYNPLIKLIAKEGLPIHFFDREPIDNLIAACDFFLSRYSATFFNAVLQGVPSVSILKSYELESSLNGNQFLKAGLVEIVDNKWAAIGIFENLLEDEAYKSRQFFLRERIRTDFPTYDGRATERYIQFIKSRVGSGEV